MASALLFCFCACSDGGRIAFENSISSLCDADFEKLGKYTTESSVQNIGLLEKYCGLLDENSLAVYKKLMSYLSYSYAEDKKSDDGVALAVKLTHIDLSLLSLQIAAEISVSGSSAAETADSMIKSGAINKFIVSENVRVYIIKENGKFSLPFETTGNAALMASLGTVNFLRWFSAQQR